MRKPEEEQVAEVGRHWHALGSADPLYGVLSHPEKRSGKWEKTAFFATGVGEIDELFAGLRADGMDVQPGLALDFGCGVGRLSQPLADRFSKVVAVDVASSMLDQARLLDRSGGRIQWVLNTKPDLSFQPDASVDLLYSNIVLQHLPVPLALAYIAEFIRVLKPGALAVFQVPAIGVDRPWRLRLRSLTPRFLLFLYRKARHGPEALADIEVLMNGVPYEQVEQAVTLAGGRLLKHQDGWYWGARART